MILSGVNAAEMTAKIDKRVVDNFECCAGLNPLNGVVQAETLAAMIQTAAVEVMTMTTKVAAETEPVGCKLMTNLTKNSVC